MANKLKAKLHTRAGFNFKIELCRLNLNKYYNKTKTCFAES